MIINAENLILGRMSAFIAKKALMGEEVRIVNCKNAVIVGKKEVILKKYKQMAERRTHIKGPFIPKTTDRFVKRTIRGMLPRKRTRGRDALKQIICYKEIPEALRNEKIETLDKFNIVKLGHINFIKVADICKYLGGK